LIVGILIFRFVRRDHVAPQGSSLGETQHSSFNKSKWPTSRLETALSAQHPGHSFCASANTLSLLRPGTRAARLRRFLLNRQTGGEKTAIIRG